MSLLEAVLGIQIFKWASKLSDIPCIKPLLLASVTYVLFAAAADILNLRTSGYVDVTPYS